MQSRIRAGLSRLSAHPRLILTPDALARTRTAIGRDPRLAQVAAIVRRQADLLLDTPVVRRELEGRRLLRVSREALRRVTYLGFVYRLTGDRRYADRARTELLAFAAFDDFNPSHFLDTAEAAAALAIGYDWLHDSLSPEDRAVIRRAMIDKCIAISLAPPETPGYLRTDNNWNQVCNAGLSLAALALADTDPEQAVAVLARAVEHLPNAMRQYEPAGAYPEGPAYWNYGTAFNVLLISALESSIGDDLGLMNDPAINHAASFPQTGDYLVQMIGPTGMWFNYADCRQRHPASLSTPLVFFAAYHNRPGLLHFELKAIDALAALPEDQRLKIANDRLLPLWLVWASGLALDGVDQPDLPLHYVTHGTTPLAVHRSGWSPHDTFVAIKAGVATSNHAHMDAGSFVMDIAGVRWADELGVQDYHSLESRGIDLWNKRQESPRWDVFRIGPFSHSVLTVDGQKHVVAGRAEILRSTPQLTVIDLGEVYRGQLASASRGIRLLPDGGVLLQDEVAAPADRAVTVRWAMLTTADVTPTATGAVLSSAGQTLHLTVRGLGSLNTRVFPTDPPPRDFDAPNPGSRLVGFEHRLEPGQSARWTVHFSATSPEAARQAESKRATAGNTPAGDSSAPAPRDAMAADAPGVTEMLPLQQW